MPSGLTSYLVAAGVVTLAEMGDKTQLLAMCFAARYKAGAVLTGVLFATVVNHALAVTAGYLLKAALAPYTEYIQIAASLSFIGFALWTVRGDNIDEACGTKTRFGPVITVALAFFLAEMGDKTQFATISLAAKYGNPLAILMGTTSGMLIADGLGIIFGVVMNKKIPAKFLKWAAAAIFAVCGLAAYIQAAYHMIPSVWLIFSVLVIITATVNLTVLIVRYNRKQTGTGPD